MWNSLERRPMVVDVLVAAVAFVFFAALDVTRTSWATLPVDVLFALALAFRRRSPGLALAVAWVGAATQLVILPSFINGNVMVAVVIYATSLAEKPLVRRLGLFSSIVGGIVGSAKLVLITGLFLPPESSNGQEAVSRVLYFVGVAGVIAASLALFWLLGAVTRVRRAFVDERLERLESEQELLRAELRVAQETERTRITREMHDAIGHSLAVIIAQSDGARYAVAKNPAAATEALGVINRSARDALDDVSELLSVLKGTGEHHGTLGVADLDGMLDGMRSAGLDLHFDVDGEPFDLSTAEDLALYRVVQESLTNALKHGGPGTRVDLRLVWSADDVVVDSRTTETDGPGLVDDSPIRTGYGIAGMNERVRLVGGSVVAGARTDGVRGYAVVARLPAPPEAPVTSIRIGLADDQPLFRAGIRMIIESQDDFEVVWEASDGAEAVALQAERPVDLILMDLEMPRMSGVEATTRILSPASVDTDASAAPRTSDAPLSPTRIVVLTTFELNDKAFQAIQVGASGFLLKNADPEFLLAAIRTVHSGSAVVAPSMTAGLVERFARRTPRIDTDALGELTVRERDIFALLAEGLSNSEIADRRQLSDATVKSHVSRILQKLDLRDRVRLVIFAYENGLVRQA